MHAKTMWDVLFAGGAVSVGMLSVVCWFKLVGERARWHQQLALLVSSLGWTCCGIGLLTIDHRDLWPFWLMACLGITVGSGVFEGVKLSQLFPTFFGRRRNTEGA